MSIVIAAEYFNVEASQSFQRNNCADDYVGTSVTYTVTAGTYNSAISQADANAKAAADIAANGQAWANDPTNGATCIPPAVVTIDLAEADAPYADGNVQGTTIDGVFAEVDAPSASGSFNVAEGKSMSIQAYTQLFATGSSPTLHMIIHKNGTLVYDMITPAIPGASLVYSDTVASGDAYLVEVTTLATGDGGYAIINNTGHNITYNIRPSLGGGLTSTGTLAIGDFLDLLGVLTGGSSNFIEFLAPITSEYKMAFQPTVTISTTGSITAGDIAYDIDVAGVTTNQGLGYNSTVINLFP